MIYYINDILFIFNVDDYHYICSNCDVHAWWTCMLIIKLNCLILKSWSHFAHNKNFICNTNLLFKIPSQIWELPSRVLLKVQPTLMSPLTIGVSVWGGVNKSHLHFIEPSDLSPTNSPPLPLSSSLFLTHNQLEGLTVVCVCEWVGVCGTHNRTHLP